MYKLLFTIALFVPFFSCAGFEEIKQTDSQNRTIKAAYYDGSSLHHMVNYKYKGTDTKPSLAIFLNSDQEPYREEHYFYKNNQLEYTIYYRLNKNEKYINGKVYYKYNLGQLYQTEYYKYNNTLKKNTLIGLDQLTFNNNQITTRRIISYKFDQKVQKSIQISQHVVYYTNGSIKKMKLSVLDKKSHKIIEKILDDEQDILDKIKSETYNFLKKARGTQ